MRHAAHHPATATTEQWIDFFYPRKQATIPIMKLRRGFLDTLRDIRRQRTRSLGCGVPSCTCHECLAAFYENEAQ